MEKRLDSITYCIQNTKILAGSRSRGRASPVSKRLLRTSEGNFRGRSKASPFLLQRNKPVVRVSFSTISVQSAAKA